MANANKINTDVLSDLIIGRVEPQIYAFTTETVPNYLKVGDTYRPLEVRLNEWRKHFPKLVKKFGDVAKVDDDTFFRDYAVHFFLENELKKSRLEKGTIKNIPHYSNEFFKNVTEQDLKKAIKDIKKGHKNNDQKYQYYRFDESRVPIDYHYYRIETYEPRPNQKATIENFKTALKKGRENLLMYAVMRFGKSFTSMCCAVEMKANFVVVVSAKADVKEEWKRTTESHVKFDGYSFLDSDSLLQSENIISEKQKNNEKIVLFLTLQDLQGDIIKPKHERIFQSQIDLLLVDETHFGARAAEYGKVLKEEKLSEKEIKNELNDYDGDIAKFEENTKKYFKAKVRIHLSGTPYRILMNSEFTSDDIIAFYQFSDIADDQEKWNIRIRKINEHRDTLGKQEIAEWKNPYFGFPQMIRFAFNPNESSRKKMEEMKNNGITYAFSELFRPQSIIHDKAKKLHKEFKYEKEILDLLKVIDGTEKDENLLSFLDYDKIKEGQMCRHIVCVLPYRASCDALQALINKNKFKHLSNYEIINISGVEGEKSYKKTESVKDKIRKCESKNKRTITLTVNRMLTGSTVHEWDTMLYLKDTASPQEYDQAIFRLQNQYIKVLKETNGDMVKFNMKPQTLLVDLNPNRMFQMQEHKSQIYNVNVEKNGNSKLEERIRKELEISPIVVLNNNKIVQIEPSNILDSVREYSSNRSVLDEATSIAIDLSLLNIVPIKAEIDKQGAIGSKQGIQVNGSIGDGDDFDIEGEISKGVDKNGNTSTSKSEKENENDKIDYKGKFAMYYARILFFSFLTDSKVKSLQEIIECIKNDKNNLRIASNLNLNKKILELFHNHINPFVLMELDYKIQNINDLATDTNLPPIQRASNAMKRFSRLSESELVTPEHIAVKMISCLPSKSLSKNSLILDIASKQGEFVYTVYKLTYMNHGKKIADNVYSIPTSKIAYEFTRKIYKFLELNINNVANKYTSFELLKENNIIKKDKLYINKQNMKFDVIVGNPPYQINSSISNKRAEKHWPSFINLSVKILKNNGYLCLITPTSWLSGSKNIVKGSKGVMDLFLENNLLSIYKGFEFPGVSIATHFWLLEKNNDYHKTDIHDISTDESYSINLNSGFYPSDLDPIKTSIIQKVFSKEGFFWVPATSMYTKYRKSATDKKTKRNTIKTYVKGGNFEEVQFAYFTGECIPALNSLSKVVIPLSGAEKFTPYIDIKRIPFCCDSYVLPLTESPDKLKYTYWNGNAFEEKISSSGSNLYNWDGNLESVKSIFYSKLFKFLIQNYRTSGFVQYPIVKRLPKFDLSKIWSDEQIFDFLELTKIERDYIIKNI
jgi:hypothetical protein